ncbi:MAG TPA: HEPN domain-containing protein [Pseudorhodoplanes sp.]|nr:HEPN domain-containing protein [Pseudorhodoplanes sp.]
MAEKRHRELVGYTHASQMADPKTWYRTASSFYAAAKVLNEHAEQIPGDTRPFALNAAISLELILKGLIASKCLPIPDGHDGHNLCSLSARAGMQLSQNQLLTLELLSDTIVWSGRYPAPKTERQWDDHHGRIFEAHVVRSKVGNTHSVMANRDTFPNWENYVKIWNCCTDALSQTVKMN